MGVNLRGRSFLKLLDFTSEEIRYSVDLTGKNIASERLFKTAVLDWLTDG